MATEKKILCPLMQRPCIEDGEIINGELCACKFWIKISGMHPQTGAVLDHFDCAHAWMPVLLIDNTQRQRETAGVMESFRNEVVRSASNVAMNPLLQAPQVPQTIKLVTDLEA